MGASYEITYVLLAAMATGEAKFACCHPEAVSPLNVTEASKEPFFDQSLPVWVPVLLAPL